MELKKSADEREAKHRDDRSERRAGHGEAGVRQRARGGRRRRRHHQVVARRHKRDWGERWTAKISASD